MKKHKWDGSWLGDMSLNMWEGISPTSPTPSSPLETEPSSTTTHATKKLPSKTNKLKHESDNDGEEEGVKGSRKSLADHFQTYKWKESLHVAANEKPKMSSSNLSLAVDDDDLFNGATSHGYSNEDVRRTKDRSQSDNTLNEACAGQREKHNKGAPGNDLEHEHTEMPRTSPRNSKKRPHPSADKEAINLISKDTQHSVAEYEEGDELDSGESLVR